jgi:hypothetical protein
VRNYNRAAIPEQLEAAVRRDVNGISLSQRWNVGRSLESFLKIGMLIPPSLQLIVDRYPVFVIESSRFFYYHLFDLDKR